MKIFKLLILIMLTTSAWATHDCVVDSEGNIKTTCHNYTVPDVKYCLICYDNEWMRVSVDTGSCGNSYVDNLTYNFIHMATDFEIEKTNPSCSSCSGGSVSST
jgi:hypothetical protein